MDKLGDFRIPVSALRADEMTFGWTLSPEFFSAFDAGHPAPDGQFQVTLVLHRTAGVVTLDFDIEGAFATTCDRCSAPVTLPFTGSYQIIAKIGDPGESTDEVIFIAPEDTSFSVAQVVYDFALLSLPIAHRLPGCETMDPSPCDRSVLVYLKKIEEDAGPQSGDGSPWDELKNVFDN